MSAWTELMWRSGTTFPRDRDGSCYWIDKHSTGGVGDKTSLILVPLVKAVAEKYLGKNKIRIPMVSGRGLGHTGGTLDKLESVPGFSPQIELKKALMLLESQGFFMMGQTSDIAPADRVLYSLRDVTGTIESIPLIVSSIMSKKLAENLDGILLDVKTGLGAFMTSLDDARQLARGLISVAKSQKMDAVALITGMDEPLGRTSGNFLEVEECADFLKGTFRESGLESLVLESAAWMLHFGSRKKFSVKEARDMSFDMLESGQAFSFFRQMFESQGGHFEQFEKERDSFRAQYSSYDFKADKSGFVSLIHARRIGVLLVELGGGRVVKEQEIDPKVGFEFLKKVGDPVRQGETLCKVIYRERTS
ncbi:MAG: thymidine phosphorylase, partial [Deltaproteobacteria bacterium]